MSIADHLQRISDDHVEALRAQYGRIKHVTYNGVDIVFRKPKRAECQQHSMKIEAGGAEKVAADEQLAQLLVVQVGAAEGTGARQAFLDLLEEYPYIVRSPDVGNALAKLTGVVQDEDVKSAGSSSRPNGIPPTTTHPG